MPIEGHGPYILVNGGLTRGIFQFKIKDIIGIKTAKPLGRCKPDITFCILYGLINGQGWKLIIFGHWVEGHLLTIPQYSGKNRQVK